MMFFAAPPLAPTRSTRACARVFAHVRQRRRVLAGGITAATASAVTWTARPRGAIVDAMGVTEPESEREVTTPASEPDEPRWVAVTGNIAACLYIGGLAGVTFLSLVSTTLLFASAGVFLVGAMLQGIVWLYRYDPLEEQKPSDS
jgi:hypothetical protein